LGLKLQLKKLLKNNRSEVVEFLKSVPIIAEHNDEHNKRQKDINTT